MSHMKAYRIFFLIIAALFLFSWFVACGKPGKSVYTIARDPSWYPLALLSKDKNLLAFSDELILEISKNEGFKVSTLLTNSNFVEAGLDNGTFDAVMTPLQPTAFRRDKYEFSDPYFFAGPVLVVPIDSPLQAFGEAGGFRIGVRRTAFEVYNVQVKNDVDYRLFDNILTGLYAMFRGEIDGVIMDLVPAYSYAEGVFRDRIKIVGKPLTMAGIRLVASRERAPGLVARFDRGLKELKETGAYQSLLQKWGLYNPKTLQEQAQSQSENYSDRSSKIVFEG